jgi:hypothetical protein
MNDAFQIAPTPLDAVPGIIAELNSSFRSGKTLSIEWRKDQLRNLWRLIDVWICYLRYRKEKAGLQCLGKREGTPGSSGDGPWEAIGSDPGVRNPDD